MIPVGLDTTDHEAVDAAAALAADTTLLINNAGVAAFAPGLTAPPEDVAREMATNFGGTYAMVRAFAPVIEGNGGGAIVNVLSMAGLAAIPPLTGYSASKAAAHSMTQAVRAELRPRGVSVHGVYPAGIGTEMLAHPSIPHSSPEEVAAGILAGVEAGDEDIFPCALSTRRVRGLVGRSEGPRAPAHRPLSGRSSHLGWAGCPPPRSASPSSTSAPTRPASSSPTSRTGASPRSSGAAQ